MWIDARLRREHDVIEELVIAVDELLEGAGETRNVAMQPVAGAIEFFTTYVSAYHEATEEQVLLPVVARAGSLTSETLETIHREHAEGAELLRSLRSVKGRTVERELATLMGDYTRLLRRHIALENAVMLPAIGRVDSTEDERFIERELDRLDDEVFGPSGRSALLGLASAVEHACRAARADAAPGPVALTAGDVMRVRPSFIGSGQSLSRAAATMESLGIRELPVVDADWVTGIIARSDLEPHRGHWEWTLVRTAMTRDPVSVTPHAPVREVARLLLERGFNAMPVVDRGRLVGMVGRTELVALVRDDERFGSS